MSHSRSSWLSAPLLLSMLVLGLACRTGAAQETLPAEQPEEGVPFVVMTVRSVDAALTDVAWMFDSIQRADMKDVVGGLLSTAGELKGIDRSRPFGQVVFLQTDVLPPRPAFIGFVPITNLEDAVKTLSLAPVTARKVTGRNDLYEFLEKDSDEIAIVVRVVGSYAFVTADEFRDALDTMPEMEPVINPLGNRYDAAISVRIKAIPEGVRQVFISFLRTQAEIELQRKDEEDEAAYLVRRSNGISALEFIDQLVTQGEDVTLGLNATPEEHNAVFEGTLNATPDSEFAKYLTDVASKTSMFTSLAEQDRPLTINVSWAMNQREKTAAAGLLQAAQTQLSEGFPETAALPDNPIDRLFESLQATVEAGHFDFFLQAAANESHEFSIVGGFKLVGGQTFAAALEQFLQQMILKRQEQLSLDPNSAAIPEIQPRADSHQGVTLHKFLARKGSGDEDENRMFGREPDMYVGASSRAFWFVVGGDSALPTLKSTIDTVAEASPTSRPAGGNAPVKATFRVAPWLALPAPERRRARERRELAEESFGPTDAITVEAKPSESGMRVRVRLDEGFVKMLGLTIAREYDRSQL